MSKKAAALAVLVLGVVFVLARSQKGTATQQRAAFTEVDPGTITAPDVFTMPESWEV